MSVVLVAIFGVAILGERMDARNWLGIAMIAGGAALVAIRS
jgi:transporter family protein